MESTVLTSVSPVEAGKVNNPWGCSKVIVPSLVSVMDEELAKEIDRNERFPSWNHEQVQSPVEGTMLLKLSRTGGRSIACRILPYYLSVEDLKVYI